MITDHASTLQHHQVHPDLKCEICGRPQSEHARLAEVPRRSGVKAWIAARIRSSG